MIVDAVVVAITWYSIRISTETSLLYWLAMAEPTSVNTYPVISDKTEEILSHQWQSYVDYGVEVVRNRH